MEPAVFWQLVGMGAIFVFAVSLGGWLLVRSLFGESTMQVAAKALGVEAEGRSALSGELDGVSVRGRGWVRWGSNVRYTVELCLHDPQSLGMASIRQRSLAAALVGGSSALEADLGVSAQGDLADLVSRMDPAARKLVAAALEQGWVHGAGSWRLETSTQLVDAYWVEQAVRRGLELTKALRRSGTVAEGLMARAQEEAPEALRVQAAELRLEVEPPLTASERALLLEQGGQVGLRVAELLGDAATLRRALRAADVAHRVRAAVALAAQGAHDDEVRKVLRAALGTADEGVAVEALGRVGTVEDVAVLRGAQGALGGAAIDDAVRAIQGRAAGAEAGQVSLAESSGGGLGLAKDPRVPEGGGG